MKFTIIAGTFNRGFRRSAGVLAAGSELINDVADKKAVSVFSMPGKMRVIVLAALLGMVARLAGAADNDTSESAIRAILQERVDSAKRSTAIVVAIVDNKGTHIVSYGKTRKDDGAAVDEHTVFEIGSVSKVFTSLLLADAAIREEVRLNDPVSKYLPKSVKVPSRNNREITLLDLATHTSGLPRLPENLSPADPANPYADYTVDQLYEFLSGYTLPRDIGSKYDYSNLGAGLLGHILALRAGKSYESLLLQRICRPLGLTNTVITLTPDLKARLARGHNEAGDPVANWDLPTLAGAGAIRSTAGDLAKFVAANLGLVKSDLYPAMTMQHAPRHEAGSPTMQIGLAWHIAVKYGTELIWHNGGTGGYHSFIGFNKSTQRGVVVLANSANSIDDLGFHLLESQYELQHFAPETNHVTAKVASDVLDKYVGTYELTPQFLFNVRKSGDHLEVQLTGQPYAEVFPENETTFAYHIVKASITFEKNAQGRVDGLTLHQNGADQEARKTSDKPPVEPASKPRTTTTVDPATYDALAGEYQLAPTAKFTVKREGDRLMVQLTGQGFFEVFPESSTKFFYKIVDAQITFTKDASGKATSLTLHQNGVDQSAKRIK